jgi:ferric-dicitrate binding protein FerR (iron transport regulator)
MSAPDRPGEMVVALTPDEVRAREALRAQRAPRPSAAFRARLGEEFVTGTIESAAPPRALPIPWQRRATTRWGASALALAAALLVVSALNQAPDWQVTAVRGAGMVTFDGVPVPTSHRDELARRMKPGVFVQLGDGVEIEAASRGMMAIEYASGTQASVPQPPGRWFQRRAVAEVRSGEIRVMTGREFPGARLALETPEARVEVTGTTFAVICEPAGTCVCVLEGRVHVGTRGGVGMIEVVAGRRRYVFADGRPEESAEMRPTEHVELGRLRERMNTMVGPRP